MRPLTQPREPVLKYATVAVARSPAQRLMYPDCPYHAAWNPAMPLGTRGGGAMPGPTPPAHVAPVGTGPVPASEAISMSTPTTSPITRSSLRFACRDGNTPCVAAIRWQACPMRRCVLC